MSNTTSTTGHPVQHDTNLPWLGGIMVVAALFATAWWFTPSGWVHQMLVFLLIGAAVTLGFTGHVISAIIASVAAVLVAAWGNWSAIWRWGLGWFSLDNWVVNLLALVAGIAVIVLISLWVYAYKIKPQMSQPAEE